MAILERLRGDTRSVDLGQMAKDLRDDLRDELPAIRHDALEAVGRVLDAASNAVDSATDDAGKAAESGLGSAAGAANDAVSRIGGAAGRTGDSIGQSIARAGRELNLDGRIDDVVKRIRRDLNTDRLTSLVAGLERELPTTDRDRYDRAYARGWTRARTSFVGAGLLAGIAAGVAGAFLLDPGQGAERRAAITGRARQIGGTASRQVRQVAATATDRARSVATERGLIKPDGEPQTTDIDGSMPASPTLVGVMDPVTSNGSGTSLHDDVITDPAATARERMTAEGGLPDEATEVPTA